MISECLYCKKIVWPTSEFCNQCFKKTQWRKSSGLGKILEFSKKDETYFCLTEIENSIKMIGKLLSGTPNVGDNICITECGITNDNVDIKIKIL